MEVSQNEYLNAVAYLFQARTVWETQGLLGVPLNPFLLHKGIKPKIKN